MVAVPSEQRLTSKTAGYAIDAIVLDPWTYLSHKANIGSAVLGPDRTLAPTWVGDHARRLNAYKNCQHYIDNAARFLIVMTEDGEDRSVRREYGDAGLLRNLAVSCLLGTDWELSVPAAEDFDPEMKEPGAEPVEEGSPRPTPGPVPTIDEGDPGSRDEGEPGSDTTPEEWADNERARKALERQDWLRAWGDTVRFGQKVQETEKDACGLGDGVYALGVNTAKGHVKLRCYDPGFYFPVLTDDDDEYPRRVHLAWEVVPDERGNFSPVRGPEDRSRPVNDGTGKRTIRRITYELVPVDDDRVVNKDTTVAYQSEPIRETCLMTDAIWTLNGPASVDDFSQASARYERNEDNAEIKDLDLRLDFIPVVHVPNTVAIKHHYGQPVFAGVLQIIDDLIAADTDLSSGAHLMGIPPLALKGWTDQDVTSYGPGQLFRIMPDGGVEVIDTSNALVPLLSYVAALLDRLLVNSRMNAAVLGRMKEGQVPSGVALAMLFAPLQTLIAEMRLVRKEKYGLVLKFAQRMAIGAGFLTDDVEVYEGELRFGTYLPVDKAATVSQVCSLLTAHAISTTTAVRWLAEAGFSIDDVAEEVERIESENFEGAVRLLDALGDETQVAEFLRRRAPEPEPALPAPVAPVVAPPGPEGRPPPQPSR